MVIRGRSSKPEKAGTPELLGLLITLAMFGALMAAAALCGPVLRGIRAAAEWIDGSPNAPVLGGVMLGAAGVALFRSRRSWMVRARPQVVQVRTCRSAIWEGQGVIHMTPRTAKIRFVLHTRKRAS